MTFELLGGRILAPYFGSSVYVWGSIITVFMLALSIGYLAGGKWSTSLPSNFKYGSLFLISAVCLIPSIVFGEQFMLMIFENFEDPRYGSLLGSLLLFFVPTTFMGMIAPYSVRLLVESKDNSGQTAGFLYFVSTIGSALGTIMTSFYFVLWFEINVILWGIVILFALSGLTAIIRSIMFGEEGLI
jgi:hypothetical protein